MYTTKALLALAALAGISAAQKLPQEQCEAILQSVFITDLAGAPQTPAAVLSFIAHQTGSHIPRPTIVPGEVPDFALHKEELCSIGSALPASLVPEFQTFAYELLQFGASYSDVLINYATDCVSGEENIAKSTNYLKGAFTATGDQCAEYATATPTVTPAPGGAANGTHITSSATPIPTAYPTSTFLTAAAARPTGAILGVAAMGGVLGAAALL